MEKEKDPNYLAPNIKVIEIKFKSMLCTSTETLQTENFDWTFGA